MPSYLDLGLIGVILVSALLAMLRGFTREILAIASWGLAAIAAYYFHPVVLAQIKPYVATYTEKEGVALGIAIAIVFLVALVLVSIITVRISDAILDSRGGALDRSLGFVFGAGRGLLLCAIAFVVFEWLTQGKAQPDWMKNAKMTPILSVTSARIMDLLPDNPDSIIAKIKKPKGLAPVEESLQENEPETKAPATTAPRSGVTPPRKFEPPANTPATNSAKSLEPKRIEAKPLEVKPPDAKPMDRQGLDALSRGTAR